MLKTANTPLKKETAKKAYKVEMLIVRPFLLNVREGIFQNKTCKFFQLSELLVFSKYLKTTKSEIK